MRPVSCSWRAGHEFGSRRGGDGGGTDGAGLSLTEVVLDASVVLKWFAAEQRGSAEARELRSEYQAGRSLVAVPALLSLELLDVAGRARDR